MMNHKTKNSKGIPDKIIAYLPVGDNLESKKVTCFIYFNSILCAVFLLLLGVGYYFQDLNLLSILTLLKYLIICLMGISIYGSYKFKKITFLFPVIGALILLWFMGFDFAYRWDAIEHVARAKFYMENDFFGSSERHSFLYLIWGFVYRIFGESEIITHLTNMVIGLAGIFGIFFIAKVIYNEFVGIISLIISLSFPVFFVVNKWAYLDMPFFSFVVFTFLFLIKYLKTKNELFLVLSLLFAFISTGTKEPAIILFPIIGVLLYRYKQISKFNFIALISSMFISLCYIFLTFLTKPGMVAILNDDTKFAIVTPLRYGFDAIFLWAGALNQELSQIIFTGLLFIGILAFVDRKSDKLFYYLVIFLEIMVFFGLVFFSTTQLFSFPVIPYGNLYYYLTLFFIFLIALPILYTLKKIQFKIEDDSLFLLFWVLIFLLFFMVNTIVYAYPTKNPLDAAILDFRYLIPAFPPLIILFSKGLSDMLEFKERSIKSLALLVLTVIIIVNSIVSLNLSFYFANSGNTHLEGYKYAQNTTQTGIIYTHWPFNYPIVGKSYDIGQFTWVTDNRTYKSLSTNFTPGSVILISDHFYQTNKFPTIHFITLSAKSLYLNPLLPEISEKDVDSVSIGIVPMQEI